MRAVLVHTVMNLRVSYLIPRNRVLLDKLILA
jgi:hypothetical protein